MRLSFCVACGCNDRVKLENHHLIPKSMGGDDDEINLITLCYYCHGKIHGLIRKDIRALTKAGLAAAKLRGVKLGGNRGHGIVPEAAIKSVEARKAKSNKYKAIILPILKDLQVQGVTKLNALAEALNNKDIPTPRGGRWNATQVLRVLKVEDMDDSPQN